MFDSSVYDYPTKVPLCRHDGSNWRCNDQQRASQGDESLGIKMALVHIKSDWAEHCGTLGFPNWTSGLRPCLFFTAPTDSWFTTDGLDSQRFLFHLNPHGDYKTACATCVIVVLVDSAAHARILPLLDLHQQGKRLPRAVPLGRHP